MPRSDYTETAVALAQRARKIVRALARAYPDAVCALRHENPFELLAATILSAQCTDARVNAVTPMLFARYPTAHKMARADQQVLEEIIHSLGFFRAKAASLRRMSEKLVADFEGEVPQSLEELVQLPGVGRKTANVLLGVAFGIATGLVVDTHVKRISRRLGLTTRMSPEHIEQDLMALFPRKEWVNYSHRVIHHGRRICTARSPKCLDCPLLKLCPRVGLPEL